MRPRLLLLTALLGLAASLSAALSQDPGPRAERVVVLGMDGMDDRRIREWMDAGELPNFVRLRDQGVYSDLMPANPAQSPVSWASINTGQNPGRHGIFDFVRNERAERNGKPFPGIGFQRRAWVPTREAGIVLADPATRYGIAGACLFLGLVLFALTRRNRVLALTLLLLSAAGGGWFLWSTAGAFPEAFPDWEAISPSEPFWVELDRNGIPFRGQGTIVSYPAQELEHGKLICGLGAPDARGDLNTSAIYTTLEERVRRRKTYSAVPAVSYAEWEGGEVRSGARAGSVKVYRLVEDGPGRWRSTVFGPVNLVRREYVQKRLEELQEIRRNDPNAHFEEYRHLREMDDAPDDSVLNTSVPLEVAWDGGGSVRLTVDGSTQEVALGSWSDFFELEFEWSPWLTTWALARFWVERDGDGLEIYLPALQIHPEKPTPGSHISWPPDFAAEMAGKIGWFETLGWACQTHAVKDAELSDDAFLADIEFTWNWRMKMLRQAAEDGDWKVLFHFFGSPDRMCHMLMRHYDPRHPQYDEDEASREVEFFGERMPIRDTWLAIYKKMDETVGFVLDEVLGENDVLLIVSDHGFDSFRREVNLNNWLMHEGFLAWKKVNQFGQEYTARTIPRRALSFVDWPETQAYSLAIGKIYLALQGRESGGMVSPEETDAVLDRIVERLYELRDPDTGEKIVKRVYRREEIYEGDMVRFEAGVQEGAAELTIDFIPGYRASWSSTGGGASFVEEEGADGEPVLRPGPVVYDNPSPWSGDHCGVDLDVVRGIFFASRPLRLPEGEDQYDARHLAPTVFQLLGVPVPPSCELEPLR